MKKMILVATLGVASAAGAQTGSVLSNETVMTGLKDARKQLEVQTENTILEKLEAARLEDERRRMREFDSLNFSVVNDGPAPSMNSSSSSL